MTSSLTVRGTLAVSLPLHVVADRPSGTGPWPIVLGLHGYAMTGESMLGILRRLAPEGSLVVSLQGPQTALAPGTEGTSDRKPGFHWGVSPDPEENRACHRESLLRGLDWAIANFGDPSRVSLVGFSQPCSFNYRVGLAPLRGVPFRAIVAICGGIPGDWTDEVPALHKRLPTAVLHVSTTEDPFYPRERVDLFERRLAARFETVAHRYYGGAHRVPSAAFDEIREFLSRNG